MISFLTVALRSDMHLLGMPPNLLGALGGVVSWQKTDIKSAFRIIPIHPADYSLLGMKWTICIILIDV